MDRLYDKTPIYDSVTEAYIGYGRNDLSKMTKTELENELARTNREIKELNDEISDADTFPSYVLKEQILNTNDYINKINKALDNLKDKEKNEVKEENSFDKLIKRFDDQFEMGLITEEYHRVVINRLNSRRELYLENCEKEKRERELKEEELRKKANKKSFFDNFKKSLSNFSK